MTKASRLPRPFLLLFLTAALLPSAGSLSNSATAPPPSDPWSVAQTISPDDFAKELQLKRDLAPIIVYVGVRTLYAGARIPGAVFRGPGSTEQGLAELKKFAATLPKDSNVLIYCGCCPLDRCPNLRPAFTTLSAMGFT